jgi:Toprim domain
MATALLGEPNRSMSGKRELRFGRKGSLAVAIAGPKAGVWHDHEVGTGGDMLALIQRERGGTFRDAIEFAEQFVGRAPREPAPRVRQCDAAAKEDHISRALGIWKEAVPIAGTVAERYLASRRIVKIPAGIDGNVLRFHPSCPFGEKMRHPCLIALMRDIHTNEPRAIQRAALTLNAQKIGRMTLAPKTGAAIKLSADADVADCLTIGEGLETGLAGIALGYAPAWAVGDAGELAQFPVLAGVASLTILVDNDESGTGQNAAQRCSKRWTDVGREVFRLVPRRPGADANDLLGSRTPPPSDPETA